MDFFKRLSRRQRRWCIGTLIAILGILGCGWLVERSGHQDRSISVSVDQTIRQLAPALGTTGFAIAKELGLPRTVAKDRPLAELGIGQEQLDGVASHLLSHQGRRFKYFVYAALVLFGWVFLVQLGRPDGSPPADRKHWYPRMPYIATLLAALIVCGFILGKSPNPMEGAVKIFKGMVGLQPSIAAVVFAFLFFIGLAIVGNKLICGWACPFGALQELLYFLPISKRIQSADKEDIPTGTSDARVTRTKKRKPIKKIKVPFWISNLVRGSLFVVMLLLLFGIVGGKKGFVIYHFLNPFNLFNWEFEALPILITVVAVIGLAWITYRPFCMWICPFGFVSWLAERFSLFGVRVDHTSCNACGACAWACPVDAAKHRVEKKRFAADCYSCGRCLTVCPHESISYGPLFKHPSGKETSAVADR